MSDRRLVQALLRTDLNAFIEKAFHTIDSGTPYAAN